MKQTNLKRVLVCSALAVSIPVTATALTNPAGTGANSDLKLPDTPMIAGGTVSTNPSTGGGQNQVSGDFKNQNSSTNSTSGSGVKDGTKEPPAVENGDLKEAVEKCPLQESADKAMEDAMILATTQPDVDSMFNTAKEAAQGCFAASSQVINLADMIPNINTSGIATATKKALTSIINQKLMDIKDRACAIADEALLSSLQPIKEYMDEYKQRVGEINGLVGNIGVMGDVNAGGTFGVIEGVIDGQIGSTVERLDKAGAEFTKAQAELDKKAQENLDSVTKKFEQEVNSQYENNVAPVVDSFKKETTPNTSTPAGAKSAATAQTFRSAPAPTAAPSTSTSRSTSGSSFASPQAGSSSASGQANKFASPEELKGRF